MIRGGLASLDRNSVSLASLARQLPCSLARIGNKGVDMPDMNMYKLVSTDIAGPLCIIPDI